MWELNIGDTMSNQHTKLKQFAYSKGNYKKMNSFFNGINWNSIFLNKDINECYDLFLNHYINAQNEFIPVKLATILNKTDPKWLNPEVKTASKEKFRTYSQLRASSVANKPQKQKEFNQASRKVKRLVFKAVVEYEKSIISNFECFE